MHRARDWYLLRSLTAAFVCGSLLFSSCQSIDLVDEGIFSSDEPPSNGQVANAATVRSLARDIDSLERHIDTYGSVTLKQPDVWGQARLTLVRNEFEANMKADLGTFTSTLQGTFSASDQAYFMNALALSAAASGTQQVTRPAPTAVANVSSATGSSAAPTPTPISPAALPTFPGLTSSVGSFGGMNRNGVTMPAFLGFGANSTIALEPTVFEEQKARFLNALHELRRINEGDDTADSPGYSLNLIRLPVSVLPGKRTDVGYGAEMTLTVTPQLSDELLPMTFRNLVLNDLVDQIAFPVTQFINNADNLVYFDPYRTTDVVDLLRAADEVSSTDKPSQRAMDTLQDAPGKLSLEPIMRRPEWQWVSEYLTGSASATSVSSSMRGYNSPGKTNTGYGSAGWKGKCRLASRRTLYSPVQVPASKSRRARMPFPPTEMPDIYGDELIFQVGSRVFTVFSTEKFSYPNPNQLIIHLPDVQGYLQEELAAVEKLLRDQANVDLWDDCNQTLVTEIRSHSVEALAKRRNNFLDKLQNKTQGMTQAPPITPTVAALTWAWIVESALLTDQLMLDMKQAAAAKGAAPPGGNPEQPWLDYYMPIPTLQARQAFNQYVATRWPIHVFALDPVQQEQNIGSTFSGSREMQLALSVGFVNGQVSAQDMMQYARRVEFDAQTIDLNGTTVGFSNGESTFGWRFYPRFQTPEIQSNAMAFIQTVFTGGPTRNQLLHQRRLEPGIRECDAIVIMPSFVPYVSVDVSTNWFSLTNPRKKDLNADYAMRLSRQVKAIEMCRSNVCDGQCYRDGDVARLYAKVRQLDTRLPFQTMNVQVPYENTLGGFAMFNTGVTDLAPELVGWYGTPSINETGTTDLFLVGDHFSVLQTSVIAGGLACPGPQPQLLSRQVLHVTIPASAITVAANGEKYVDVQVATPYGVTQHLMIPVCDNPPPTPPAIAPAANTPAANTPAANTPAANTPAANTPAANTPAANTPAANTPAANTPAANTPAGNTPAGNTSDGNAPATTPAATTPATTTPSTKTPSTKTPSTKTPSTKAPSTKAPSAGSPAGASLESSSAFPGFVVGGPSVEPPTVVIPGRVILNKQDSAAASIKMPLDWNAGHATLSDSSEKPPQPSPSPLPLVEEEAK